MIINCIEMKYAILICLLAPFCQSFTMGGTARDLRLPRSKFSKLAMASVEKTDSNPTNIGWDSHKVRISSGPEYGEYYNPRPRSSSSSRRVCDLRRIRV